MPPKSLLSILDLPELTLPYIEHETDKSFLHFFEQKMAYYIKQLKTVSTSWLGTLNREYFVKNVDAFSTGIQLILEEYLNGYPAKAYVLFKNLIEELNLETVLIHFRTIDIESDSIFYRTKKEHNATKKFFTGKHNGFIAATKKENLFHVAFEKRKTVGTNRFSIPGFPCIYLSDSLQTSWSECMSKLDEPFHAISFKNHRPLYMMDLSPLNTLLNTKNGITKLEQLYQSSSDKKIFIDYAFVYPLILACHSKIKYIPAYQGEVQFKSEYIIPQLLLQWYREKRLIIDGVRYLSCTAEMTFPKKAFSKFNYVIPVVEVGESGYCSCLRNNFSTTPVYTHLHTKKGERVYSLMNTIANQLDAKKFKPF